MVHLFLTEALAVDLLALCQRAGMVPVVRELRAELGPGSLLLPCDDLPILSIWDRGGAVDYYHADTAEAVRHGITRALAERAAARRDTAPLFAEVEA